MIIFAVMNRAIDIGNETITGSKGMQIPGTYRDTFDLLLKYKIISLETANSMTRLMKYRNIIAHEYYELSSDEIFKLKDSIHETGSFIEEIRKYVQKQ